MASSNRRVAAHDKLQRQHLRKPRSVLAPYLQGKSFPPTALLNFTIDGFHGKHHGPLHSEQEAARTSFVSRCLNGLADTNMPSDTMIRTMKQLMRCIDKVFFSGVLTHTYCVTGQRLVRLNFDYSLYPDLHGYQSGHSSLAHPHKSITLMVYFQGRAQPFLEYVETLLHEMCHAYLDALVCRKFCCRRNTLNTIGLTGHGRTFEKLFSFVLRSIRPWHPQLSTLGQGDHPSGRVGHITHQQELDARALWESDMVARGYNPYRKDNQHKRFRYTRQLRIVGRAPRGRRSRRRPHSRSGNAEEEGATALHATVVVASAGKKRKSSFIDKCGCAARGERCSHTASPGNKRQRHE